ncbi:hypothetical protein EHS15_09085 [Leptospira idonii]|uniref:Yip1 domain-containing protein n=2 Tax=Leptospira idonii TaxID=1193500 RepID=A0A4R9LYV5_9LEPT|nr:hypothetical protein EHS15_09085 [Leptospira idonii]
MQNSNSFSSRMDLVRDVFFSPKSAFESFFQKQDLGGRDLFLIHIQLAALGIISKFVGNLIQIFVLKVTTDDEDTKITLLQGVFAVFVFYFAVIVLLRLLDSFRIYHKMRDRLKDWQGPEPHVFAISFIPFSTTAVFWFLPAPFPLLFIALGGLYSLQLSYMFLSMMRGWTSFDFLFFFMKALLFFLFLAAFPLLVYNIIRTVVF